MKTREEQIKERLDSKLINEKCYHDELLKKLEEVEKVIINEVFEKGHGAFMKTQDVIDHLRDLQKGLKKEDCKEVNDMLLSLNCFRDYLIQIKQGTKGERFVNEALEKIPGKRYIFAGLEIARGPKDKTELDNVVVTNKGVFIIETKWRSTDCYISKEGNLMECWQKHPTFETLNILESLSEKKYILRELLAAELGYNDSSQIGKKIHPVIVWANRYSALEDKSKSATIKYCYNIAQFIEDYDDGQVLSEKEKERIIEVLGSWTDKEMYDIDFDLENLKNCIIKGLPSLEVDKEEEIISQSDIVTKSDNWKEYVIGGAASLGLLTTIIYITKRLTK